jgi:hypothetical protein
VPYLFVATVGGAPKPPPTIHTHQHAWPCKRATPALAGRRPHSGTLVTYACHKSLYGASYHSPGSKPPSPAHGREPRIRPLAASHVVNSSGCCRKCSIRSRHSQPGGVEAERGGRGLNDAGNPNPVRRRLPWQARKGLRRVRLCGALPLALRCRPD